MLVLLVYAPTLANGFIWDDDAYVENNATLTSLGGLRDIWFKLGAVPQYYPLVHSTFWIEHHAWGLDPRGYHAVNLLLHAIAAVLVWRILLRLAVPGAWLAAAIFAVHPVEVESVAWITERKNVLSCVLALASILAYLRFSLLGGQSANSSRDASRGSWNYYALALIFFVAALLSKTVTASVPAVLAVIAWWKQGRLTKRDLLPLMPFFAVGLALAWVTVWMERTHVGAQGAEWDFSLVERVLIAGRAVWFYAAKLFWPYPLVFFYPRWTIDSHAGWQYLFPLSAVALLVVLWSLRNRIGRGPLAAALIFGGVLVPALGFINVFPFLFSFVADHFQYHASIALIALAAAALTLWLGRMTVNQRWALPVVAACVLAPLAILAHVRTYAYRDLATIYADTIAQNPACWIAHNNLGWQQLLHDQNEEAVVSFRRALEVSPTNALSRINLAQALYDLGRRDEAAADLAVVLAGPASELERARAHLQLGLIQFDQKKPDEAVRSLSQAVSLDATAAVAYTHRGRIRALGGDVAGGLADLERAARLKPADVQIGQIHASILGMTGKYDQAIARLRALGDSAVNPEILLQIGALERAARQFDNARETYTQALAVDPRNVTAYRERAGTYLSLGRTADALADYKSALQIRPRDPELMNNVAWLLATSAQQGLRNGEQAVQLAVAACEATAYKQPDLLGTLAAAYAETGDFDTAISWSQKAIALAMPERQKQLQKELESYRARKPWREE